MVRALTTMNILRKLKGILRPAHQRSLLEQIEEIPSHSFFEDGEEPPSRETISKAKAVVAQVLPQIDALHNVDLDVHPFEGSIRIVWSQGAKTLKLVIPEKLAPYVYHQDGEEYSALPYDSVHFTEWLNWLSSDQRAMAHLHSHAV
jgi:hypothetical protein